MHLASGLSQAGEVKTISSTQKKWGRRLLEESELRTYYNLFGKPV